MIQLDFQATHPTLKDKNGASSKWFYEGNAGWWLAEVLETRVNTENPGLEYRVSAELRQTSGFNGTDEEIQYIKNIVISQPVDNLFKGQILARFP